MKKLTLALFLGLLVIASLHAQQTVVIERPGILTDLATAAGTIVTLPLAAVEGIVVGTVEAAGSLVHGSTTVVVTTPAVRVPVPVVVEPAVVVTPAPAVVPSTTIITTYSDGTVTTVTRRASAYELGSAILPPVGPSHRVGPSPHANPYVYRYR